MQKTVKPKKILLVAGGNLVNRGVESFLIKWIQCAPKENYQFDLYIPGQIQSQVTANKLTSIGVDLLSEGDISSLSKVSKYVRILRHLIDIINNYQYDFIHVNTGNITIATIATIAAKKCKQEYKCIIHSHNAIIVNSAYKKVLYTICELYITRFANQFVACSKEAATSLFGSKIAKKVMIMNNCIDTKAFKFSLIIRNELRDSLGIGKEIVIGHVGHFTAQKNHEFLIKAFYTAYKLDKNIRLILIGNGELENAIDEKIKEYNLGDRIIHIRSTDEVQKYMCMMDVFVLPSLYEGLPIVGVEAQASGLPCIFSDTISPEVSLCDNVEFLPINNPLLWGEHMLKQEMRISRDDAWLLVKEKGYDLSSLKEDIFQLYNKSGMRGTEN